LADEIEGTNGHETEFSEANYNELHGFGKGLHGFKLPATFFRGIGTDSSLWERENNRQF